MRTSPSCAQKLFTAVVPPFAILAASHKTQKNSGRSITILPVVSFAEPSAGYDFCGTAVSMADNSLQKTAKTASGAIRRRTTPCWLCASYGWV